MKWVSLTALVVATILTVGVWRVGAPVQPEALAWWAFAASLLLLAATAFWVWMTRLRSGRSDVPSLIEGIPPLVSWTGLAFFVAAVGFHAVALLQYSPPLTGQLLVVGDGRYARNNHGTLLPTTEEDYRRSLVQEQRTYLTGAVATCAVAVLVAAAGAAAKRQAD